MSDHPNGFVLTEAAMYSFLCQEVYPDIISFAAAIPEHLRPIFLTPLEVVRTSSLVHISSRIAGEVSPSGIGDSDLFGGYKTFVNYDIEPTIPSSEPGSIFDVPSANEQTKHQEYNFDENVQVPADIGYMSDVDITEYFTYPNRTIEKPVRHSSLSLAFPLLVKLSMSPEELENKAHQDVVNKSKNCNVRLNSYSKKTKIFTFSVKCDKDTRTVQAALSGNDVLISCDCPYWRWNGPEFHAKSNSYMLGNPYGSASPPDIRDKDRKFYLCKHAHAVLKKFNTFVEDVSGEEDEIDIEEIDKNWDELEDIVEEETEDEVIEEERK